MSDKAKSLFRSKYSYIFSSPKWMLMVVFVNTLLLMSFTYKLLAGIWCHQDIEEHIESKVFSLTGLNLTTSASTVHCVEVCW